MLQNTVRRSLESRTFFWELHLLDYSTVGMTREEITSFVRKKVLLQGVEKILKI